MSSIACTLFVRNSMPVRIGHQITSSSTQSARRQLSSCQIVQRRASEFSGSASGSAFLPRSAVFSGGDRTLAAGASGRDHRRRFSSTRSSAGSILFVINGVHDSLALTPLTLRSASRLTSASATGWRNRNIRHCQSPAAATGHLAWRISGWASACVVSASPAPDRTRTGFGPCPSAARDVAVGDSRRPGRRGAARLAILRWLHSQRCLRSILIKFLQSPTASIGRFLANLNAGGTRPRTHRDSNLRSAEFRKTLALDIKPPFSLHPIPLVAANGAK